MARKKNANRAQAPAPSPHAQSNNNTSDNAQAGSWFLKFPPFVYDPTAGLRSNFDRLAAQRNWGEKVRRRRWVECQEEEFGNAFGTDTTKLESWQKLCREVHISDPPESISGCKKLLGSPKVLVNLVNLIDHRNIGVGVIRFKNFGQFQAYTVPDNVYPKKRAKKDGFIKALLRRVI